MTEKVTTPEETPAGASAPSRPDQMLDWEFQPEQKRWRGFLKGDPGRTLFLLNLCDDRDDRCHLLGAFMSDSQDRAHTRVHVDWAKFVAAEFYLREFIDALNSRVEQHTDQDPVEFLRSIGIEPENFATPGAWLKAHDATERILRELRELAKLREEIGALKDPATVRANILRGQIVLPTEYISKTDEFGEYQQLLKENERLQDVKDQTFKALVAAQDNAGEFFRERDQLRKENAALFKKLEDLAGYASTVRLDRLDSTREFALQTVDWCKGLVECVREAGALLTKHAGASAAPISNLKSEISNHPEGSPA